MATGEDYLSPRWCAILGFTPDELRPHVDTFAELLHPDDHAAVWQAIARHEQFGEPYDLEYRMRRKNGEYLWVRSRGQITHDPESGIKRMTGSISDVSKQKRAEERLHEAHRLAGLGAWERDFTTDTLWWSPQQYRVNGVEPGTPVTQELFTQLLFPDDVPTFEACYQRVFEHGSTDLDYRIVRPDGELRHIYGVATLTRDASGRPLRMSGTNQDVTERVRAQESIRRSLAEKETLLREIHHRVKNNLAIVGSLLHFHANKLSSPRDVQTFTDLRQRLHAMSLVHERLYQSHSVGRVDFAGYVHALTTDLCWSSGAGSTVQVAVSSDEIGLAVERAMPAGQILCELVMNVIKYAFPGERSGRAQVCVRSVDANVVMSVDDDGVGLPAGFDPQSGSSFGWQLVRSLVKQLDGTLEVVSDAGVHVRVVFPVDPPEG